MRPGIRRHVLSGLARGLLAAVCAWNLPLAQAETAPEARRVPAGDPATLKAAFLYNFALYTTWPPPPPSAVTLCSIGHDELGAAFDALANKQIDGKPVHVRRVDNAADARSCHVLFVPDSSSANLPALARGLASQPVLIVSDAGGNLDSSMILIEAEGNRLAFSVNLARVRHAGLDVSSKLLRLARVVR
ncbi:MAG: hypothetical protein RL404_2405 [Pseudomonadota bacterium]|jgi:hypothetical protein